MGEKNFNRAVLHSFNTPQYREIRVTELEEIEVHITDTSGHLIPFNSGVIYMTLHFKKHASQSFF